jgi:dTDP-4-dehydrorhamnose reductase
VSTKILIIGANGQIGTELSKALADKFGSNSIITSDLSPNGKLFGAHHEQLDATEASSITEIVKRHEVTRFIYWPPPCRQEVNNTLNGLGISI